MAPIEGQVSTVEHGEPKRSEFLVKEGSLTLAFGGEQISVDARGYVSGSTNNEIKVTRYNQKGETENSRVEKKNQDGWFLDELKNGQSIELEINRYLFRARQIER